jgi:hypothetical protein
VLYYHSLLVGWRAVGGGVETMGNSMLVSNWFYPHIIIQAHVVPLQPTTFWFYLIIFIRRQNSKSSILSVICKQAEVISFHMVNLRVSLYACNSCKTPTRRNTEKNGCACAASEMGIDHSRTDTHQAKEVAQSQSIGGFFRDVNSADLRNEICIAPNVHRY